MRAGLAFIFVAAVIGSVWWPPIVEARWCAVHNPGLGDIQWACHFRTLSLCAAAVGPASDFCLENPNWYLYRRHRWHATR